MSYETAEGGVWMSSLAEKLKTDASICDILTAINSELIEKYNCLSLQDIQQPTFHSQLNEIINLYREAGCHNEAKVISHVERPCSHAHSKDSVSSSSKSTACSSRPNPTYSPASSPRLNPAAESSIATPQRVYATSRKEAIASQTDCGVRGAAADLVGENAKEKLESYTTMFKRLKPTYNVSKDGNKFKATVYVVQVGRVTGPAKKTKREAEETAASEMLSRLYKK